jgi:hypothetical protein
MATPKRGTTYYSPNVPGSPGNFNHRAQFDYTDGYIGITALPDRVLLSPAQYRVLVAFVVACAPRPRAKKT